MENRQARKFYEYKAWNVFSEKKKFFLGGSLIEVEFYVDRVIKKWLWGFYKSDELVFGNTFDEIKRDLGKMLVNFKDFRKVSIMVEIEMLKMRLKYAR